jgi:site-specific DNA-adenine methylase
MSKIDVLGDEISALQKSVNVLNGKIKIKIIQMITEIYRKLYYERVSTSDFLYCQPDYECDDIDDDKDDDKYFDEGNKDGLYTLYLKNDVMEMQIIQETHHDGPETTITINPNIGTYTDDDTDLVDELISAIERWLL